MRRRNIAAVAVLLASGCGAAARGAPYRIVAGDINPRPRAQVRDGGVFRPAVGELRAQWNYWHLGGTALDTYTVLRAMMPMPFRSDSTGRVARDADYLAAAKVTERRPRQVVVYELNPRARWSDGTPLGVRDFRAMWRALRGRDRAYEVTTTSGYDRIESIRPGRSDRQVVVTFARPYGDWRKLFGPLYPARFIDSPGAWNRGWLNRIPATAGPFRPLRIDRTAKTITLVHDSNWWGRRTRLDRVVFRAMSTEAAVGAYVNGEIDTFDVAADAAAYARARTARGGSIRRAAGPDFTHITFNGAGAALADRTVRRAVAMAIDRRALARAALKDLDWPPRTLNDHVFMNTQQGYRDNAGSVGRYDPAGATRLLAGRRPPALRFVYPASLATSRQISELVRAMLRRVGIEVTLWPVPDGDFFDRYVLPGDYDLTAFTWHGTPYPVSDMSSVYGRPAGGAIQQNFARIGSARLDATLDRAAGELDPARARRVANDADAMIWDEVHSITLYQRPQIVPTRAAIANWGAFGFADPDWTEVGFTR